MLLFLRKYLQRFESYKRQVYKLKVTEEHISFKEYTVELNGSNIFGTMEISSRQG